MKKFILLAFSILYLSSTSIFAAPPGSSPPGLSGKGGDEFPQGLEKQEKTPPGWSHGQKQGWSNTNTKHQHLHTNLNRTMNPGTEKSHMQSSQ